MSRKKILLPDDVELFLMLERTVFNRNEFELITARSGRDILKLIKKEEPELVFLNLFMTDLNGDECCRIVKGDEKTRDIPIIMVVQGKNDESLKKCRLSGCDDILFKPVLRNEFLKITRRFLHVMERADQRIRARVPIKYSTISQENRCNYSIDLNTGGLFLETENPLSIDTPLELEFQLPTTDSLIRCKGRGAWINDPLKPRKPDLPAGMGIQFMDLSLTDMNAINEFVNGSSAVQAYA